MPSRPGLFGDKPQSGESGSTAVPLLFFFVFGESVRAALEVILHFCILLC